MSRQDNSTFRIGSVQDEVVEVNEANLTDPEAAAVPAGFSLSAWCILPAIGGVALLALSPKLAAAGDASSLPLQVIFNAAILLGLAFLGSLVVYFTFGKSRTVASLGFTLVVGLMSVGRVVPTTVAGAMGAVNPVVEKKETLGLSGIEPVAQANLAQLSVSADASKLTTKPDKEELDPKLARSAKRWVKTASQLATTYRKAREAFEIDGGLDFAGLDTRRECSDRLALLTRVKQANDSFAGYVNTAPETMRRLLSEDGVSADEADSLIKGFLGGFNYDLQVSLRETRAEFVASAQAMLQLARDHEGQWTMDSKTGMMAFKNVKDTAACAEFLSKAKAAAARDLEIQRQLGMEVD